MPSTPLTWNEIRARALTFVAEWRGETDERREAQSFWNDWFEVFGISRRRYVTFEEAAERVSTGRVGRMDAFWHGMVAVEHKSAGRSLGDAVDQALDYLGSVDDRHLPKLVIASDFGTFRILDMETREVAEFPLDEFPDRLEMFGFIAGYRTRTFADEEAVNVRAAELMGRLFDELRASGYEGHDLRMLLVRILFLLFADDTGVWERGLFADYVMARTSEDGRDVGMHLDQLFQVLNTEDARRQSSLDEDLTRFPHINGGLFSERIATAAFDTQMRQALLNCCHFDWSAISPAVFGSMFQAVMDPEERRAVGAHYTTEANILKVIEPLFLDDLRAELAAADTKPKLTAFKEKLARLRWLDPAAGCGNFLVVSYREVRRLELEALRRLRVRSRGRDDQLTMDAQSLSSVTVEQFYGIEHDEWPARIAEVAMYLVDHQENMALSREFGLYFARFPIEASAHIRIENAIRFDWNELLPNSECDYLLGNPPFIGKQHRVPTQKVDMEIAFGGASGVGVLDYVAAWWAKASDYIRGTAVRGAFVSTNSICQGEQVPALWPRLYQAGLRIDFAHRTFAWTSEARGKAAVHVVVIGFSDGGQRSQKILFDHPRMDATTSVVKARAINPYLVDGPEVVVTRRRRPLRNLPACRFGNMPNDGGQLILSEAERAEIVVRDTIAAPYIRELIGAEEMLNGLHRYCLWLAGASPSDLRRSRLLADRVDEVRDHRNKSTRAATKALAATPALFGEIRQPTKRYLCLPRHSSMNRRYIPMAYFEADQIAHDSTLTVEGADDYLFGLLASDMFMTWVRTLAGRLKSDYRLSAEMVYNTFPFPDPAPAGRERVAAAARQVLETRDAHPGETLASLYDPRYMPTGLLTAHRALDRAVVRLYVPQSPLATELARQEVLFARYVELARRQLR